MLLKEFSRSKEGVASVEFIMVLPVMLAFLLGVIEFSKYTMVNRRAEMTTNMMAEYLSRDPDHIMSDAERDNLTDMSSFTNINAWRDGEDDEQLAYSYAGVDFEKDDPACLGLACTFSVKPLWHAHGIHNYVPSMRSDCDMEIVSNTAPQNGSDIPEGFVGRSAVVRVQTVHRYVPLIENGYIPFLYIKTGSIKKTRSGNKVDYPNAEVIC